ncbi:MAG: DUF4386 domain-containing protein [Steroidobacteraceae bacterium]
MTTDTITTEQQMAARVAGFLYLFLMATSILAETFINGPLIVAGDVAQTAHNIAASNHLFRFGTVVSLLTFAGDIVLVVALYVLLKPVNRSLALLAAFWRLAESAILGLVTLNNFAVALILSGAPHLQSFSTQQLQGLARLFYSVSGAGYHIGFTFLALGGTLFSYLMLKSRYVPRLLAGWGAFAYLVMLIVTLIVMIYPDLSATIGMAHYLPAFVFEVTAGFWLLVKGVRR